MKHGAPQRAQRTQRSLHCHGSDTAEALQARLAIGFAEGPEPPSEIMFMPGGEHDLTATRAGKPIAVRVLVDPNAASALQQSLQKHLAASAQRPYFDFDHEDKAASAWPLEFLWKQTPAPGVYARLEWSKAGAEAVRGKAYRAFSPTFYDDPGISDDTPRRVIGAPLNMGGLVNNPAFKKILPLWAKQASEAVPATEPINPNMNELEKLKQQMEELQAKLQQLEKENRELKAAQAGSETTEAIKAKEAEIKAKDAEIAEIKGQLTKAQEAITAQRKKDADIAVKAAVSRGAIPPQNLEIQAKWRADIEANPERAQMLEAIPSNPLIDQGFITARSSGGGNGGVQLTQEDIRNVLHGYIQARDAREAPPSHLIGKVTPEAWAARNAGLIYSKELDPLLAKGGRVPFELMDAFLQKRGMEPIKAVNALGTLVGNIISQRTLALVVSKRPMLRSVVTDFSDEQARLNQVVYTRTVGLPAVNTFGAAATDTGVTDYTVTLNQHRQALFSYTAAEYNSTGRNPVAEHSNALALAIGNYMVDQVAALITAAFTLANQVEAANLKDYGDIVASTKLLNTTGLPQDGRFGWVNSDVAEALRNDELVMANFDRSGAAYASWKNIEGFEELNEFPALPGNSINLIAFLFHRNALLIASRISQDPQALIGAGYPGRLQVVTDPVTGLSVVSNQWIGQNDLAINDRLIILFGAARGLLTGGQKWVSA